MEPSLNIDNLLAMNIEIQALECSIPELNNNKKEATLIAKILTPKAINMNTFKSTILKAWNPTNKVTTNLIADNTMAFIFENEQDLGKISKESWTFRDHQLILARWPPDKAQTEIDLDKTNLWVHAYGIPVSYINENNARAIGNSIGSFVSADLQSSSQRWKKSLRIQVEININYPLRSSLIFAINDTKKIPVELRYERITDLCFNCGRLGHKGLNCTYLIGDEETRNSGELFGPWLKFENTHISNPNFSPKNQSPQSPNRFMNKNPSSPKNQPTPMEESAGIGWRAPGNAVTENTAITVPKVSSGEKDISTDNTVHGPMHVTVENPAISPGKIFHQQMSTILSEDYHTPVALLDKMGEEEAIFTLPTCYMIESEKRFLMNGDFIGRNKKENQAISNISQVDTWAKKQLDKNLQMAKDDEVDKPLGPQTITNVIISQEAHSVGPSSLKRKSIYPNHYLSPSKQELHPGPNQIDVFQLNKKTKLSCPNSDKG
ncbi:hypothetical protein CASFOL_042687 [Castilleja foliolosa]|uniref:CCHC-type domain-containing protein n=1 Tax=Castilleja foliolosa TaxID=1961234 RepID=A0ABD3B817_9LAMI